MIYFNALKCAFLNFENGNAISKWWSADKKQEQAFRSWIIQLQKHTPQPDTRTLTSNETLMLARLIAANQESYLAKTLKQDYTIKNLMAYYELVTNLGLDFLSNIAAFNRLPLADQTAAINFLSHQDVKLHLSDEVIKSVCNFYMNRLENDDYNLTSACELLSEKQLLNNYYLLFLSKASYETKYLRSLLGILYEHDLLTQKMLSNLFNNRKFAQICELFDYMKKIGVELTESSIKNTITCYSTYTLGEILEAILNSHDVGLLERFRNGELDRIFKLRLIDLDDYKRAIVQLSKAGILSEATYKTATMHNLAYFRAYGIFKQLMELETIATDEALFLRLFDHYERMPDECQLNSNNLAYLVKHNLLTPARITLLTNTQKNLSFDAKHNIQKRLELYETLHSLDVKLSEKLLSELDQLSKAKLEKMNTVITSLAKKDLADEAHIQIALNNLLISKQPEEKPFFGPQNMVTVHGHTLYVDDYSIRKTNCSKVTAALSKPDDKYPAFCIKELKGSHKDKSDAKREVKYMTFFGRESWYYRNNDDRYMVAYKWLQGTTLYDLIEQDQVTNFSFLDRMNMLKSLWQQVEKLHSHYRIHADIKTLNVIINPDSKEIDLIDFGSTHKATPSNKKNYPSTPGYAENHRTISSYHEDIYALGATCAQLFPELFDVTLPSTVADLNIYMSFKIEQEKFTPEQLAIAHLISATRKKDTSMRTSAKDGVEFISQVLDSTKLTKAAVNQLAEKNINREDVNEYDCMLGRKRVMSL